MSRSSVTSRPPRGGPGLSARRLALLALFEGEFGPPRARGALQRLAGVIADHKANIVETKYDRAYYGVVLGDTVIDITMETRGPEHVADLTAALEAAGYPFERVQ